MPDHKEQNSKGTQSPKSDDVRPSHIPEGPQSGNAPLNPAHKRQRRIEDWFPN